MTSSTSQARASGSRRRPQDLRALIIAAAEQTFGEHGFRGATTVEIAARAGVSRSVLTRNFPTKTLLFEAVITTPLVQFADEWAARWANLPDRTSPGVAVREFVSDLFSSSMRHRSALRLLLFAREELGEGLSAQVWSSINDGLDSLTDIAEQQLRDLGYPAERASVTIRAIVSMVIGYISLDEALMPGVRLDDEAVTAHLADLIRYGLALGPQDAG